MSAVDSNSEMKWCAEQLITPLPSVTPHTLCKTVFDLMIDYPDAPSFAVIEDKRPVALLTRQDILVILSKPLARAAYEKRSVARLLLSPFITANPLVIEGDIAIEHLKETITLSYPRAVIDGVIITRGGEYLGIGSGINLLGLSLEQARNQIAALNESQIAAQQASRAKSTFLATISHELRTPLNAVIGFSEVLQQQYFGKLNDKQTEYISDILSSGQHLLELINDILDLSKAESGKLDLVEEEVDFNALTVQSIRMLSTRIESKDIAVTSNLPCRALRVAGDRQKLKQVLINLLTNAVKFTQAGGAIGVSAIVEADGTPALIVADTGMGIAQDSIEKMLMPFERAQTTATLAQEGTGIGLPISKAIVEQHGGTLSLHSELGRGTTVIVRLPRERLRYHLPLDSDNSTGKALDVPDAIPKQRSASG